MKIINTIIFTLLIIFLLMMVFCKHEVPEYDGKEVEKAGSYSEFYIKQIESENGKEKI